MSYIVIYYHAFILLGKYFGEMDTTECRVQTYNLVFHLSFCNCGKLKNRGEIFSGN